MEIRADDLSSSATQELLRLHLAGMHANSPPGHVFALDLSGLQAPGVTVWSARKGEAVCGIGALKQLDAASGEVRRAMQAAFSSGAPSCGQRLSSAKNSPLTWNTTMSRPSTPTTLLPPGGMSLVRATM